MTEAKDFDTGTSATRANAFRRYALAIGGSAMALVGGAIVLLWAWNTVAVELFAAPSFAFRHTIAVELAVLVLGALSALVLRIGRGGRITHEPV